MRLRYSCGMTIDLRSNPIVTLSLALSKSSKYTLSLSTRAARRAASFTRFARSAPLNPGVPFAMSRRSTLSASNVFLACTSRIAFLPFTSGLPM